MKILMVHNRYRVRGGEDESGDAEVALLRQRGHQVDLWELTNDDIRSGELLRTGFETVWSRRSYSQVYEQLKQGAHDLLHVQNFFPQASPAVHYAAKAAGKPIVQSLRNYRLLCLNGFLFRDGHVCEDCLHTAVPWPGVVHACYRGSTMGSAAVASMLTVHRALHTWQRKVDVFIALAESFRGKLVHGGVPPDRIRVKPNFVLSDPGIGQHRGGFALFVGRLSPEKGVLSMIKAWNMLADIPLKIIGDGPLEEQVREAASGNANIQLLGRMPHDAALALMKDASMLIFPSEWYEGFGRSVIEAFATGLPVVTSNIGSPAELVGDGLTGLHFSAGDPADLAQKVRWACSHPGDLALMGRKARDEYELKYTAEVNYQMLMQIYQAAIEHARRMA